MRVKTIVEEDFTNYRKPSMFIGTISCNGKCCTEQNLSLSVCHNDEWRGMPVMDVDDYALCERYLQNPISHAIVFGGLEPFEQFNELEEFIHALRLVYICQDDIVIYTGYYPEEITEKIKILSHYKNIIIKYGRYIPDDVRTYDPILGVTLASSNQFAKKIS